MDLLEPLFYNWPGGYVPTFSEDKAQDFVLPSRVGSDTPGIFFVQGAPGIDEACDEVEAYHYVYNETPRGTVKDIFRDNEDHVAGIEYANEEWEEGEYVDYAAAGPPVTAGISYNFSGSGSRSERDDSFNIARRPAMRQTTERVG